MSNALDEEVDGNFDAFRGMLPNLLTTHEGEYALLRHRHVADYFGNLSEAFEAGLARYSDRLFSVQEVTGQPADLGFFSHAVDTRLA